MKLGDFFARKESYKLKEMTVFFLNKKTKTFSLEFGGNKRNFKNLRIISCRFIILNLIHTYMYTDRCGIEILKRIIVFQ